MTARKKCPKCGTRLLVVPGFEDYITDEDELICPECEEDRVPFSLTCSDCDATEGHLLNKAEALAAGWVDIGFHDGPSWNFIGTCPACAAEMAEK